MRFKLLTFLLAFTFSQAAWAQTPAITSKSVEGSVMVSNKNAYDNLKAAQNFSIFVALIDAAGLKNRFTTATMLTVLAPANKAFNNLPTGILDTLRKPENQAKLITYVNSYILQGKYTSADLARQIRAGNGQVVINTMAATKLYLKVNPNRNITITDALGIQTVISRYDIMANNAIIHTITTALPVSLAPIPLN